MANRSQQQNTTLSPKLISSSENIAWLTVYGIEAVAIVTLNALTAIIYLKERSLRKSSMCLVISLSAADIFFGGLLIFDDWLLGSDCNFWTIDLNRPSNFVITALFRLFPLPSVTNPAAISLEWTHATFRPFAHRLVKKKIFGGAVVAVWVTAGLSSTISVVNVYPDPVLEFGPFFLHLVRVILLALSFCYPLVLYVYTYKSHPWKSTVPPWCNQQRKETDQDIVYCDNCIFTSNAALYYFLDSFFSVLSKPSQFNMVSFKTKSAGVLGNAWTKIP